MGKGKLAKFKEMEGFHNVLQPSFDEIYKKDYKWKGHWKDFFNNDNPLILELGCGKGEYTVNLGNFYPLKNFIGIDIKGARMWKGAARAINEDMANVVFIRTRIEMISSFFAKNEIDEIWLTFPDPQLKKRRAKKRLTSARFLNNYRNILKKDGIIHLKTDSTELYDYTKEIIRLNGLKLIEETKDLYAGEYDEPVLKIRTYYESMFLDEGKTIKYLKFGLNNKNIVEVEQ